MPIPSMLKAALTPGSLAFLALCLTVALLLKFVFPRRRRVTRAWLAAVAVLYVLLSLPVVATAIVDRLPAIPQFDVTAAPALEALIVFDGDNRVGRVEETMRIHRAAPGVRIIVLGEGWIPPELATRGVPDGGIVTVSRLATTRDQVSWLKTFTDGRPADRLAVVASRIQMARVVELLRAAQLAVTPAPAPIDAEPRRGGVWAVVPTYIALRASRDALYEHAALAYYRWRGWIASSGD